MSKHIDVSIIIVNFNTKDLLGACLSSLAQAQTDHDVWEVIVVDNGSIDGSIAMVQKNFPWVTLIPLPENKGFAAANNVGIKRAKGNYIALLNSDTEVSSDAIRKVYQFMSDHPHVAVATCTLLLPDGHIDPACHRGFPTPWAAFTYIVGLERLFPTSALFGQYHQGYKNMTIPHEIDSPSGAFFFVRRKILDTVGLLDEDYFMYGEDLDWAYRIKQAGWQIMFYPSVSIVHKKKQSGRVHQDAELRRKTQRYFIETMRLFYEKHYKHRYSWFVTQVIFCFLALRLLIVDWTGR